MAFSFFPKLREESDTSKNNHSFNSYQLVNKEIFETLFENHPDAVFTIDPNRQIQHYNKTFKDLFNYNDAKLRSYFNRKILNMDVMKKYFSRAMNGEEQKFKFDYIDQIDQQIEFDITFVPLIDMEENVTAIYGIAKNITEYVEYQNEINEMKIKLELAQQTGKIGTWDYDTQSDELYWSRQLYSLTGRDENDYYVLNLNEGLYYVHPEDRDRYRKVINEAITNSHGYDIEYRLLRKDTSFIYVNEHVEVIYDQNGLPIRFAGVTQDITDRKQVEKKLLETKIRNEHIYENLQLGILSFDPIIREMIMVSSGIESITGYPKEYFYTLQAMESIVNPDDRYLFADEISKLTFGKNVIFEYRIVHKNGNTVWVHSKFLPVLNDNGELIRVDMIISDITQAKQQIEKTHRLAYYDSLTELPKSELFNKKIESLIEGQKQFSILYLDINRLKSFNLTLGHEIVNELLKQITKRIGSLLNQPYFFARCVGDEFGIILWNYDQYDFPEIVAKKILECLYTPFIIDSFEVYVTANIGISNFSENGRTVEELIKNATAALNRSKTTGKNNYHIFSSTMNISSYKQYELERDLRKALKNNQLLLHFQPRVDTKTRRLVSAEALIRWEHPTWGLVSPGEFLPIAEEVGLINEIGDWVFQHVCEYLAKWKQDGLKLVPISINFVAQRFLRNDCIPFLVNTLKKYDIDPSLIELEITETSLIYHEKEVEKILSQLDDIGIKVALDDFGTGYSSLAHIKDFIIDTIKIDKSFIQQISIKQDVEIIIKSLIFMAKGLNINIVAEGVETLEQYEFLKQQECSEIQGYLFSKPVPESNFIHLLTLNVLKLQNNFNSDDMRDRRTFYRIQLMFPLKTEMTITSFKGKEVNLGKTEIAVDNLGAGGLKFYSTIQLPVRPDIVYQYETVIMGEKIQLQGHIVWKNDDYDGIFEYGVSFTINEKERQDIIKHLNKFTLKMKNNVRVPETNFIYEDPISYIKKINRVS